MTHIDRPFTGRIAPMPDMVATSETRAATEEKIAESQRGANPVIPITHDIGDHQFLAPLNVPVAQGMGDPVIASVGKGESLLPFVTPNPADKPEKSGTTLMPRVVIGVK